MWKMDPGAVLVFFVRAMAAKWGWEARVMRAVYWYQQSDRNAIRIMVCGNAEVYLEGA